MTITYPNRTVLKALLLSRGKDTLRAAIAGADDVRIFTLIHETWVSEECEPVQIEFAWSRSAAEIPTEADCICSKALASRLVAMLFTGCSADDVLEDVLWVSSGIGEQVRIEPATSIGIRATLAN